MIELICQQRYRVAGVPIDISPYRNHGRASDTGVRAGPAGSAASFPNPDSMIQIDAGTSGAWSPLVALKIEMDIFADVSGARTQALLDGDGAFQMAIDEFALSAWFNLSGGGQLHIRSGDQDSPDHQMHAVPTGRWVTLGVYHDGFANVTMTFDGELVAQTVATEGVHSVGGGGIAVGNWLGSGAPLAGAIEELRIWRADPRAIRREFLCRPFGDAAACWETLFGAMSAWAASNPDWVTGLLTALRGLNAQVLQSYRTLPPDQQAAVLAASDRIIALWCQGSAGSDEIAAAVAAFVAATRAAGVSLPSEAEVNRLAMQLNDGAPAVTLDCDPWGAMFFTTLGAAMSSGGPA